MRLPSHLRLKESRDFARIRREGGSHAGRALVLAALRVDIPHFAFGLITSKKVGGAVVRNRIRRRLREIIRAHLPELLPGWHWVVIARWRAPQLTQVELEQEWLRLARRLRIIQPAVTDDRAS